MTDELERLALAATPGPWDIPENNPFGDGRHVFADGLDGTRFVVTNCKTDQTFVTATNREQQQRNAAFIAAANPAAILDHLAANRKMRAALERIADPRNIHFAGDAQVVARSALSTKED